QGGIFTGYGHGVSNQIGDKAVRCIQSYTEMYNGDSAAPKVRSWQCDWRLVMLMCTRAYLSIDLCFTIIGVSREPRPTGAIVEFGVAILRDLEKASYHDVSNGLHSYTPAVYRWLLG